MNRLQGKTAVITGGNSGVGAAAAILFASEGANVVISARRQNALDEVAEKSRPRAETYSPCPPTFPRTETARR